MCDCICTFEKLLRLFKPVTQEDNTLEIVEFLMKVPLLRKQLPKADLLLIAVAAHAAVFDRGAVVVKQGEESDFILVKSGVLDVNIDGDSMAHLVEGDYWGDGSLVRGRPSAATLMAESAVEMILLPRQQFEALGLGQKLSFPQRPALSPKHESRRGSYFPVFIPMTVAPTTEEDNQFIVESLKASSELLDKLQVCDDELSLRVAAKADVLQLRAGEVIARQGDFSHSMYIVKEGVVEAARTCTHRTQGGAASDQKLELKRGDVFGQIAMLSNRRALDTFTVTHRDAIVYRITRDAFKSCFFERDEAFLGACRLLNDSDIMKSLFCSQRQLLARDAVGFKTFVSGEVIQLQGVDVPFEAQMVYIIESGSAILGRDGDTPTWEVEFRRGGAFGVREALLKQSASDTSVYAGRQGVEVLCIEGTVFRSLGLCPDHTGALTGEMDTYLRHLESMSLQQASAGLLANYQNVDLGELTVVGAIGRGSFGFLTLMEHPKTRKQYALKRISKGLLEEMQCVKSQRYERDLMLLADSDFVVRLLQSYRDDQFVYMLQDYSPGGSLLEQLDHWNGGVLPENDVRFYVACITLGLEHLQSRHIVYRDLKPDNVLLDSRGYLKICDLGLSSMIVGRTTSTFCGTMEYIAPEMMDSRLRKAGYGFSVDWWSLGVLTWELFAGVVPFQAEGMQEYVAAFKSGPPFGSLPDTVSCRGVAFVKALLCTVPEKRLGHDATDRVLDHVWYTSSKFDLEAFREQRLTAPVVPAEVHNPLPSVELWDETNTAVDILVTRHERRRIVHGNLRMKKRMSLERALDLLRKTSARDTQEKSKANWLQGMCFETAGLEEPEGPEVHFFSHPKADYDCWGSVTSASPRWTSFRSHADLHVNWVNDGSHWDDIFDSQKEALQTFERQSRLNSSVSNRASQPTWIPCLANLQTEVPSSPSEISVDASSEVSSVEQES